MNTFDLKGSRFKRKVIQEEEYDQIWGSTSHLSNESNRQSVRMVDGVGTDPDKIGSKINALNITDELRMSSTHQFVKRKSREEDGLPRAQSIQSSGSPKAKQRNDSQIKHQS